MRTVEGLALFWRSIVCSVLFSRYSAWKTVRIGIAVPVAGN